MLLATAACAPGPELLSPSTKPLPKPRILWPRGSYQVVPPPALDRMPVVVPDTEHLAPMPVSRGDPTSDREMAVRGFGNVAMIRLRGPAGVPMKPPADSVLRIAPPR
ncbi:MAG TPA: hypothetical protein VJT67_06410 [Longimicrobiaceae bacterium]|nr:hypothetical protein [Longimicrobiaceae bacterium]